MILNVKKMSLRSTISWAGSLLAGVYLTSGPIVGGLVNKFGCRPVCIAGGVVSSLGLALSTLSPNVGVLMLTYGVIGGFGLGQALFFWTPGSEPPLRQCHETSRIFTGTERIFASVDKGDMSFF